MDIRFFAYLNRLKYINRWSLMHSTVTENVSEHALNVTVVAHALAVIANEEFGEGVDEEKTALLSVFHESSEVLTGDLPTPIKYGNQALNTAYKELEDRASRKLLEDLPQPLRRRYDPLLLPDKTCREYALMKAADKLCALIKCKEELRAGNREFAKAAQTIGAEVEKLKADPPVAWFAEHCLPAFDLSLDELDGDR